MGKKSVFRTDFGAEAAPSDPEALFRDLKGRSPEIKHLWSHQADLLRVYSETHLETGDVALELPTGAGKTLVGLLIAEFRRRKSKERVAYLCPTRQLAHQVGTHAAKYGINAHVFVGRQVRYPADQFSEYEMGNAIAITTYSGVFNSNPRIGDAQTIILDDAHASESYIADMWSLQLARAEKEELYSAVLNLFADALPPAFVSKAKAAEDGDRMVEAVPGKHLREKLGALRDLLDSRLAEPEPAWYTWQILREHVDACNAYVCHDSVLIRPLIPPSMSHLPFNGANQRVYMSATLGLGGELERITGVRRVERIPVPAGWESRGTGRRLFLAPFVSLDNMDALEVVVQAMVESDRSLALAPNRHEAEKIKAAVVAEGLKVIRATDIEDSVDVFTGASGTVLLLTRYDGLDLPDETCRTLVFSGLPGGINLQERFLMSRLAAASLLRDRILTRFAQGVGRCTRSDSDYAIVFLLSQSLAGYILKPENRSILHPELQAELEFGIENSGDQDADGFRTLREVFLEQGDEWERAEEAIVRIREGKTRAKDPVTEKLREVVGHEVDYVYALWAGNYEHALEKAKMVSDALGGDETKGYRGWWYYLTGDAALIVHEQTAKEPPLEVARDYFGRAATCSMAISWFAHLARSLGTGAGAETAGIDEGVAMAVEAGCRHLDEWGLVGKRFEDCMSSGLGDIGSDEHTAFHRGLKFLGSILGFDAETPEGTGVPDCVWSLGDLMHITHEAKTEHTPEDAIGVNDVRQAQSHGDWVQSNRACGEGTEIVCVIETPRESIDEAALPHAKTLCAVSPSEVRELAAESVALLRSVRSAASGMSDEAILEELMVRLRDAKLTPGDIVSRLTRVTVGDMPTG